MDSDRVRGDPSPPPASSTVGSPTPASLAGRIRATTREAVLEAMRTLGYRPSRSARSLASGRTRMLGVLSFDAARYGPAAILTAVNTAAQEAGYLVSSIALDTADHDTVVDLSEDDVSAWVAARFADEPPTDDC